MNLKAFLFGQRQVTTDSFAPSLKAYAPHQQGFTLIVEGDSTHQHSFEEHPWDHKRLGPPVIDHDPEIGGSLSFPMATYQELFRCQCGAEGIKKTRALI